MLIGAVECPAVSAAEQFSLGKYRAKFDVPYREDGSKAQRLDVFFVEGKKRPLVVWIHGGGWRSGSKDQCPALFLVRHGYAVASIDYRLTGEATWPAQIEDCKAAIKFLRKNASKFGVNPDRIGVWGGSAGGHIAAMLGVTSGSGIFEPGTLQKTSSSVQAVCDWFGPSDLVSPALAEDMAAAGDDQGPRLLTSLLGGSPSEKPELGRAASPITHVSGGDPPFLIMHGDRDSLVPISQSEKLASELKSAGVKVKMKVVENAGHAGREWARPEVLETVRKFFDEHLK